MTPTRKKTIGILITVISIALVGIYPAAAQSVYADGGNAILVLMAVTTIRLLALLSLSTAGRYSLFRTRTDMKTAMTGGFFQFMSGLCMSLSLMWISGPLAVIIFQLGALILLFFTAWRGEAKLNARVLLATFAALGGLSLALDIWRVEQTLSIIGIALAFSSATASASRLYIYGYLTKQRHPAAVGAETFVFTMLFVILLALFQPPAYPASTEGWLWLLLGSTVSAAGAIGMFYGVAMIGAFEYSLLSKLDPVFTALFTVLLVGEVLSPLQYLGMAVVIASLMAYQYGENRRKRQA